jgi:hypothetical protein
MEKDTEVLIVRNTVVNRLYDIVMVNYFEETVDFIVKGVQYDHAVAMMLELQETN